jgi:hypothetical protein
VAALRAENPSVHLGGDQQPLLSLRRIRFRRRRRAVRTIRQVSDGAEQPRVQAGGIPLASSWYCRIRCPSKLGASQPAGPRQPHLRDVCLHGDCAPHQPVFAQTQWTSKRPSTNFDDSSNVKTVNERAPRFLEWRRTDSAPPVSDSLVRGSATRQRSCSCAGSRRGVVPYEEMYDGRRETSEHIVPSPFPTAVRCIV